MQANYRFVVHPGGEYHAQAVDADVHLDWDCVLQVLASAQSQAANCPICLSKPVAPRMAKCGHIFCLPCLIRFMHSTDDVQPHLERKARWKKCPICDDIMYVSDTRPLRWFVGQEGERPQEGGDVVLRLIKRRSGDTLALPRDGAEMLENSEDVPWYFAAEVMDYARIMRGSEDYMIEQYEEEIAELRQQEKEDELMFGEDTQWSSRAITAIQESVEKVQGIGNPPVMPNIPLERKPRRPPIEYRTDSEDVPEYYAAHQGTNSGLSSSRGSVITQYERSGSSSKGRSPDPINGTFSSSLGNISINSRDRSIPSAAPKVISQATLGSRNRSTFMSNGFQHGSPFFFYEALLHFYLASLDIRILRAAFEDYSLFPATILPRVEHVSTGHVIDEDLRRRAKYLSHLPLGCEVGFLECDWTDVVSPEILERFSSDIERRRKKNQEKATREEKERVRAEKEEDDKRWAAARRRRPSLSHDIRSSAEFQPLPPTSAVDITDLASSPPWASREQQGSAFASLASPSTSPATQRTVWGTRIATAASPTLAPALEEDQGPENDGWLQDWEAQLLREDDLVAQLEATSMAPEGSKPVKAGGAKKKKGKKITLMSTNAKRGA